MRHFISLFIKLSNLFYVNQINVEYNIFTSSQALQNCSDYYINVGIKIFSLPSIFSRLAFVVLLLLLLLMFALVLAEIKSFTIN